MTAPFAVRRLSDTPRARTSGRPHRLSGDAAAAPLPLAAEAAAALAEWALARGAHRVHLLADVANVPSQEVARRAGFVEEGRMLACLPYRDRPHGDAVLFSRLPTDPLPG